jgi:hypothetical protein
MTYDTLIKDPYLAKCELTALAKAVRETNRQGLDWLVSQFAPNGPIMKEREFSTLYKTSWALWRGGRVDELSVLLDWVKKETLQPTGDLCYPDLDLEQGLTFLRLYRQSYLIRAAVLSGHALGESDVVRKRFLQFQDPCGAAVGFLEDDGTYDRPTYFDISTTSAFGMCAIDLGALTEAQRAGDWVATVVGQNANKGERFYFSASESGLPDTACEAGHETEKMVCVSALMQPTQVLGITAAFLLELYFATRSDDSAAARRYLAAAHTVFDFERKLPWEAFFNWNRVKLAWSGGLMLQAQIDEGEGTPALSETYQLVRRTFMHSLKGTQLADGAWGHDLYPASSAAPETRIDQRTMEGFTSVPSVEEWQRHRAPVEVGAAHRIEVSAENTFVSGYLAEGLERVTAVLG